MSPSTPESKELRKARRRRLTERLEALRQRVSLLELELADYSNDFFRACIFGSARIKQHDAIYELVEQTAYLLAAEGIDILTGGGPGLMDAASIGAQRGREDSGNNIKSIGLAIQLHSGEQPNDHLDIKHSHRKFSTRLDDFMRLSHVIIVTPGGIGTLLELVFTWQLIQVKHLPARPIILMKKDFWSGLIEWMKEEMLTPKLVNDDDFQWIHYAETPEDVMTVVNGEYIKFKSAVSDR